jgi:hypothetical protein
MVADFVNDLRAFEQRGEASDPTEDVQNVLGDRRDRFGSVLTQCFSDAGTRSPSARAGS